RHTRSTRDWSSDVCSSDLVAAGADAEVDVRARQLQLVEEELRHPLVVVLAGVDQPAVEAREAGGGRQDGRDLHEVRAGADEACRSEERRVGKWCGARVEEG